MTTVQAKSTQNNKVKDALKQGFTTGACAAAAAKAAAYALINERPVDKVEITLPAGSNAIFNVHKIEYDQDKAEATIIKDAGDDPDVTNGAEIGAEVTFFTTGFGVIVKGGKGVGLVTKPGLPVPVGQPAINPVPMKMIKEELCKVLRETDCPLGLEVVIFVPQGEELARKTLNARLGIVGGISILGTTGIVEPISAKAWTDTVTAAMSVAKACGITNVVLTPGRTSEMAAMRILPDFPEEAFIQMGDHVGYSLAEARKYGFVKVIIVGQFGKLVKMAMGSTRTHANDSTLELGFLADLALDLGLSKKKAESMKAANTAREVFLNLRKNGPHEFFEKICDKVGNTAHGILGGRIEFECIMVDYEGKKV